MPCATPPGRLLLAGQEGAGRLSTTILRGPRAVGFFFEGREGLTYAPSPQYQSAHTQRRQPQRAWLRDTCDAKAESEVLAWRDDYWDAERRGQVRRSRSQSCRLVELGATNGLRSCGLSSPQTPKHFHPAHHAVRTQSARLCDVRWTYIRRGRKTAVSAVLSRWRRDVGIESLPVGKSQ